MYNKIDVLPTLKKVFHVLKIFFLYLALLFLFIVGAVNLPIVHRSLTRKANTVFHEKGLPLNIGKLTLLITGKIGFSNVEFIAEGRDTIVYAGKMSLSFRPLPLLFRKVLLMDLTLQDGVVNLQTDDNTGKINLLSFFPTSNKPVVKEKNAKKPWDIQIDAIHLRNIRFRYKGQFSNIVIRQNLQKADLAFDKISISQKHLDISYIRLEKVSGFVSILNTDTIKETTSTPFGWNISVRNLNLNEILFSLNLQSGLVKTDLVSSLEDLSGKDISVAPGKISASKLDLTAPDVTYASQGPPSVEKKSSGPISILSNSAFSYECKEFRIKNGRFSFNKEGSDSASILNQVLPARKIYTSIKDFVLSRRNTAFDIGKLSFELNNQVDLQSGNIIFRTDSLKNVNLSFAIAATVQNEKLAHFKRNDTVLFSADLSGSSDSLKIEKFKLHAPSGIDLYLSGRIIEPLKLPFSVCKVNFSTGTITSTQTRELIGLFASAPELKEFRPFTISGSLNDSLLAPKYDLSVLSDSGKIELSGKLDLKNKNGNLKVKLTQLNVGEMLGIADLDKLCSTMTISGDWKNPKEIVAESEVRIDSVRYKKITTRNINMGLSLDGDQCLFNIMAADTSLTCSLKGLFDWSNKSYTGELSGNFSVDAGKLNLLQLKLRTKGELVASLKKSAGGLASNLDLKNFSLSNGTKTSEIKSTHLALTTNDNVLQGQLKTDFIDVDFNGQGSPEMLKKSLNKFRFKLIDGADSSVFTDHRMITDLPGMNLSLTMRYDSIFNLFIPDSVFSFKVLRLTLNKKSNDSLLYADFSADNFIYKSIKSYGTKIKLEGENSRLSLNINQDSLKAGNILTGSSSIGIDLGSQKITGNIEVRDHSGTIIYKLGVETHKQNNEIFLKSTAPEWTLNSHNWNLSGRDIFKWNKSSGDMFADLHLKHDQMKIDFYGSKSENLHLDMENVMLSMLIPLELTASRPDGTVNANLIYRDRKQKNFDFNIDIGQIKTSDIFVRRFKAKGNLIADSTGILESNLTAQINDTASITAELSSGKNNNGKSVHSTFNEIPVALLELFIKKYADKLHGTASGEITLSKSNNKIREDGFLKIKEASLRVIPLNANFSIPDAKIELNKNKLSFTRFMIRDSLQRNLIIDGNINIDDPKNIIADLHVKSDNIQIMNTRAKDNPVFFGSIFINSGISITGSLDNPAIKGSVDLAGGTNVTYRYTGDATVAEAQKVITFAKLNGNQIVHNKKTTQQERLSRMPTIQTSIEINPKSVFNFEISSNFDVSVKISGAGLLQYATLPNNTMSLTGSYEIQEGTSELKMTGWPRKFFTIASGSTVRWNGKIEDPEINLEATSRVRGSYENPIDNKNRDVDFLVSMKLSGQLSDISIVFDVKCPDQYISSVLNTLSPEERMMQAVNLLLFEGIDLPGIKSSNNYLTSQINGFWENQLNSITKSNVKSFNVSFGIDSYTETSASGGQQDYTSLKYEVEKKLLHNRVSVKLSGRVNDVKQAGETSNNMIENFTLEYALDTINSKYLKLYRNQDYEDILEGEVIKSGVGYIYRKSYDRINEIWKHKDKNMAKQDSSEKQK